MEKDWFLRFSMSLLITYLVTLSLEKEIIVLEKRLEKSLDPKICTGTVHSLVICEHGKI